MPLTRFFRLTLSLSFALALLPVLAARAGAAPTPTPTPSGAAMSPEQLQLTIAKGRVEKLKRLAYASHPDLKRRETEVIQLNNTIKKLQTETRDAIDRYLKQKGLKAADLPALRLEEITAILMRIMPYRVVLNKEIQPVVIGALHNGQPVFPADFARQFPDKKPADVPDPELLAFYVTHLKAEAAKAQRELDGVLAETKTPAEILKALKDISMLKCALKVYVIYLNAVTPDELKNERHKLQLIERSLKAVK